MTAGDLFTAEFYEAHRAGARGSARVIVPLVIQLLGSRSVVDVGCGSGTWLSVFAELGVRDFLGIDGAHVAPTSLDIPAQHFLSRDLERPFDLGRRFDLTVSLEVAEHLPPAAAAGFVESLTGLSDKVLFSAAIPGQGGTNHVNEQWPAYWAALFEQRGFVAIDWLRRRVWDDPRVDYWYAQNSVLYVHRQALADEPRLAAEHAAMGGTAHALVHPRKYDELIAWAIEQRAE